MNGRSNLRRTTSEGGQMNNNCVVNTNGTLHQGDVTTEDEWSRASSEDRSDSGGVDKQSNDDLDKKVQRS